MGGRGIDCNGAAPMSSDCTDGSGRAPGGRHTHDGMAGGGGYWPGVGGGCRNARCACQPHGPRCRGGGSW